MALTDTIKRAPRWAWITAGGIGIAVAGIKLWNGRGKSDDETAVTPTDGDAVYGSGTYGGPLPTTSGNPVATIVPPVIIAGNDNGDAMAGVGALQDLYVGAVANLIGTYQDVWGPVQTAQLALLQSNAQTIQDLALAGSAPNSQTAPPAPIIVYAPPEPVAPVALPAYTPPPAAAAPVAAPQAAPCPSKYPFRSSGGCYQVACASGNGAKRKGRWHVYSDGHDVFVNPVC